MNHFINFLNFVWILNVIDWNSGNMNVLYLLLKLVHCRASGKLKILGRRDSFTIIQGGPRLPLEVSKIHL